MIKTANFKYAVHFSKSFKKDYKRIKKQGKDISKLKIIIEQLANGEQLDPKYKNHYLTNYSEYKKAQECHVEPDWLLVYQYANDELILLLINTGSHSELFNK